MLNKLNLTELLGRSGLALALAAALVSSGCTTDRMRGPGSPGAPPLRLTPASPAIAATVPPPPPSSAARPAGTARLTAAEAAAVMAMHQPRVRVLGPSGQGVATVSSGALEGGTGRPLNLDPIATVNNSINSVARVPGVTSSGEIPIPPEMAGSLVVAPSTVTGTPGGSVGTPTLAGAALPPLSMVVATPAESSGAATVAGAVAPSVAAVSGETTAGSVAAPTLASSRLAPLPTLSSVSTANGATAASSKAVRSNTRRRAVPASTVRVVTEASGRVLLTNAADR